MILSWRIELPRVRFGFPEGLAGAVTTFGIVALVLHADSPPSLWCWGHVIALPLFGWLIGDLPLAIFLPVALGQLFGGFVCWSLAFRIGQYLVAGRRR